MSLKDHLREYEEKGGWIRSVAPILLGVMATVGFTAGDPMPPYGRGVLAPWVAGLLAAIVGALLVNARNNVLKEFKQVAEGQAEQLKDQARRVKALEDAFAFRRQLYRDSFRLALAAIADIHGFSLQERITVFKVRQDGSDIVQLGRFSPNTSYDNLGRGSYPTGRGLISEALLGTRLTTERLPNPKVDLTAYRKSQTARGLLAREARALSMPSRCYYFSLIPSVGEGGHANDALVLIESTRPRLEPTVRRLDEDDILQIQQFIGVRQDNEPTLPDMGLLGDEQ